MSKSFFQRHKPTTLRRLATAASLFALCSFSGCSNDDDTLPAGSGTGGNSAATTAVASTTGTPTNNQNSDITTTATGSNPSAAVTSGLTTTDTTTFPSTNNTSTDTKNPGNAPALEELVAAACGWGERCCDAQEFRYIYGTDVATCTLEVLSAINSGPSPKSVGQLSYASKLLVDLVGTIDLDRAQLSPENAKACLTHLRERTCLAPTSDKSSCDPKAAKDPCALSKIFVGTIPIAGPCDPAVNEAAQGEVQCAPGARCELDPTQSNLPRCVVKAQAGQACIVTSSVESNCDAGLFCSDKTGTCTKHAQAGEVCAFADTKAPFVGTETIPCAAGLSCSAQTLRCVSSCEASSRCGLATKGTEVAAQNADLSLCAEGLSCVCPP